MKSEHKIKIIGVVSGWRDGAYSRQAVVLNIKTGQSARVDLAGSGAVTPEQVEAVVARAFKIPAAEINFPQRLKKTLEEKNQKEDL